MEISKELQDLFKSMDIKIPLFPETTVKQFKTLKSFYDFIAKENDFWNECNQNNCNNIRSHFTTIKSYLDNAIGSSTSNMPNATNQLNSAISSARMNTFPCVYSITAYGQKLKEIYKRNPTSANAFYDYLYNSSLNSLTSAHYLDGALDAHRFFHPYVTSDEIESKNNHLNELAKRFNEEHDELHSDYLNKRDEIENNYTEYTNEMNTWKETTKSDLEVFLREKNYRFDELESTYLEKLKLKAPAEHWDNLFKEYEEKGREWKNYSIYTVIVMTIILLPILYWLPASLRGNNNAISFDTIRSTLVLAIIISLGIYLLRLFIKLSTSAYHLARDAKERYQLTYFYLSLINEKAIEKEERTIVLQALFSRADTGLLKGDSSPAIPEGMVQQAVKLVSR